MPKRRTPRPWSQEEIEEIRRLAQAGSAPSAIASKLDRSSEEIEWAAARHAIKLYRSDPTLEPK